MTETQQTIGKFCDKVDASEKERAWALANCHSVQDVWNTAPPRWLLWIATRPGVTTDRERRLFAVWCARLLEPLPVEIRDAINVAARYADGEATLDELQAAQRAVMRFADNNPDDIQAWVAVWAAGTAGVDKQKTAIAAAAAVTKRDAASAALVAARIVANAANDLQGQADIEDAQAQYIRDNFTPDFTVLCQFDDAVRGNRPEAARL